MRLLVGRQIKPPVCGPPKGRGYSEDGGGQLKSDMNPPTLIFIRRRLSHSPNNPFTDPIFSSSSGSVPPPPPGSTARPGPTPSPIPPSGSRARNHRFCGRGGAQAHAPASTVSQDRPFESSPASPADPKNRGRYFGFNVVQIWHSILRRVFPSFPQIMPPVSRVL